MALKKSEFYSSLWQSCDVLRCGMDASQYKDSALVLLFGKFLSDQYTGFQSMIALKIEPDIDDHSNKKIVVPLTNVNKLSGMPDFNNPSKLDSGEVMVE